METTLGLIVLIGAALAAIYKWLLKPAWCAVRGVVHWVDATPVLMEIAEEFKPNAGSSLRDRIDSIEGTIHRHQAEANTRFDSIESKIDAFILDRRPGGQRHTD